MISTPPKDAFIVHLQGPQTTNGNPNRVYLISTKEDGAIAAIEEGYEGFGALYREFGKKQGDTLVKSICLQIPVSAKFIKDIIKEYGPDGSMRSLRIASDEQVGSSTRTRSERRR